MYPGMPTHLSQAVIMTTDWCATNSGVGSNSKEASSNAMDTSLSYGFCDVACELTLSFRTLGTIAVFLSIKQYRDELFDYRTLFRRLWSRLKKPFRHSKSGTVRFNDDELEAVRLIPSGAYLTCLGYVEALRVSSSVSVYIYCAEFRPWGLLSQPIAMLPVAGPRPLLSF
jgi:hypothetical protein